MAFIGSILTTGSFTGAHKQVATLKSSGGGGGPDGGTASSAAGQNTSGSFELVIRTGDVGNGSAFRGTSGSIRIDVKDGGSIRQALRVGANDNGSFLQTGNTSASAVDFRIVDISNVEYMRVAPGSTSTVFNEGSADLDFRVESNGLTHAIFVEGSSDRVAIGSNAPMGALDVNDNGGDHCIVMRNNDASGVASQYRAFQIGSSGQLYISGTSGKTQFISDVAGADSEVFILSKLDAGGSTAGDGRIWFGHKAADGTTNSLEAYMGYDVSAGSTQAIRMGFSSTFGGGERLTLDEDNGVVVVNEDSGDIDFRVESNTSTKAFFVDGGANKIYCGLDSDATLGTPTTFGSDYAKFTIVDAHSNPLDKAGGSGDNLVDFALELRNHDVSGNSMTGIAFNVNTERDANSVGAAIVAERDSTAAADATLYDTNLHFMTNDSGDIGNTVRMTISHDGKVQIGNGSGDLSATTGLVLITDPTLDATADYGDPDNYHLVIHRSANDNDAGPGIAFSASSDIDNVGAAIVFERNSSESRGDLLFLTKESTTANANPAVSMAMTYDGKVGINNSDPQMIFAISARQVDTSPEAPSMAFDWEGGNAALGTGQGAPDADDILGYMKTTATWTATGLGGAQTNKLAGQMYWAASENWSMTSATQQGTTFLLTNRNTGSSGSAYILYSPGQSKNVILNGATDPYDTITTDLSNKIVCVTQIVPAVDNSLDLGHSSARWDDVRATNGTIATSDANLKDQIATSALGLDFICRLRPVSYKWKDQVIKVRDSDDPSGSYTEELKTFNRTHYGLVAQEVESVMTDLGMTGKDFAGYCSDTHNLVGKEEPETVLSLRYTEFISPIIKAVQELKSENDSLRARIEALES